MLGDADPGRDGSSSAQGRSFESVRISAFTAPCEWAINFYRKNLSPLFPPCCRFTPTCSAYALEAYRRHGFWRGSMLTVWRILRCNPFCRGGFDPVPPARTKFNQTAK